jgi:hypothetical protein
LREGGESERVRIVFVTHGYAWLWKGMESMTEFIVRAERRILIEQKLQPLEPTRRGYFSKVRKLGKRKG